MFRNLPALSFIRDKVQTLVTKDTIVPANTRPLPVELEGSSTISAIPSGLTIAGRITIVSINNLTWTALPATALANRNAICILNTSAVEIKLQYDNTTIGYVGVPLAVTNQRFYDITDDIIIYAKSSAGTVDITVEELS